MKSHALTGHNSLLTTPRAIAQRRDAGRLAANLCAIGLMAAGALHLSVGLDHAGSNFGALSFMAGIAQGALGSAILRVPSLTVVRAIAVLNAVLILLYIVNDTIGLPPLIAHTHVGGNNQFLLFTLAWPGPVEWHGVLTIAAEALSLAVAARLWRSWSASDRSH